jgi:hypothetical protein
VGDDDNKVVAQHLGTQSRPDPKGHRAFLQQENQLIQKIRPSIHAVGEFSILNQDSY